MIHEAVLKNPRIHEIPAENDATIETDVAQKIRNIVNQETWEIATEEQKLEAVGYLLNPSYTVAVLSLSDARSEPHKIYPGLNEYIGLLAPVPDSIHASSSTTNSITEAGLETARAYQMHLTELIANKGGLEHIGEAYDELREKLNQRMVEPFQFKTAVSLLPTRSGTESELIIAKMAMGMSNTEATTKVITVGTTETGSTSLVAAGGKVANTLNWRGETQELKASVIEGIETRNIVIRQGEKVLTQQAFFLQCEAALKDAQKTGAAVVLPIIEGTKTGEVLGNLAHYAFLQDKYPDVPLIIKVDAAQLRVFLQRNWE
jgi:hypothetical protein